MLHQLEKFFDETVRPVLAEHGGNAEIIDVDNNYLYIKMTGGCQGCASSKLTLKQGIEQLVKQHFPEIVEIIDMTDHASGENPFM